MVKGVKVIFSLWTSSCHSTIYWRLPFPYWIALVPLKIISAHVQVSVSGLCLLPCPHSSVLSSVHIQVRPETRQCKSISFVLWEPYFQCEGSAHIPLIFQCFMILLHLQLILYENHNCFLVVLIDYISQNVCNGFQSSCSCRLPPLSHQ